MNVKDVTQLPLWEHAAESGRFAEYVGAGTGLQSWNLVGKALVSSLTLLGGLADVVHLGLLSSSTDPAVRAISADQDAEADAPSADHVEEPLETAL